MRDFRGLLFLRSEDGSLFAPLGLRFGKQTGSLSAVPVIRGGDVSGGMPPSGTGDMPPTVRLSASATSIERGQSTTLTWSSSNATSGSITPGIGTVPTSGSRRVTPTRTTTYRITVRGGDGQTASASTTVTVTEPPAYAERRAERTMEDVGQALGRSLQYQTSDGGWRVLRNSPEEGFSAGTDDGQGQLPLLLCVPNQFYGASLVWSDGSDSLGTDYVDGDDQAVTLSWRVPNLTQRTQWNHLSLEDQDADSIVLFDQIKPQETDEFLDRLSRHAELNAVVTVSSSGSTKQATFSLDGAPAAETVKACGQEQTSSETTLYFADFVDGGGWSVQLVLSNIGTAAEDATAVVEAFDQAGRPVRDLFDPSGTLKIPSLGNRVLRSSGVGEIRRGWIQVRADTASVTGC